MERVLRVDCGDGAVVTIPAPDTAAHHSFGHRMRYGAALTRQEMYDVAECFDSYLHLLCECSRDEAWRRIKLLREAVRQHRSAAAAMLTKGPTA